MYLSHLDCRLGKPGPGPLMLSERTCLATEVAYCLALRPKYSTHTTHLSSPALRKVISMSHYMCRGSPEFIIGEFCGTFVPSIGTLKREHTERGRSLDPPRPMLIIMDIIFDSWTDNRDKATPPCPGRTQP